jgi:hypothetical protein
MAEACGCGPQATTERETALHEKGELVGMCTELINQLEECKKQQAKGR